LGGVGYGRRSRSRAGKPPAVRLAAAWCGRTETLIALEKFGLSRLPIGVGPPGAGEWFEMMRLRSLPVWLMGAVLTVVAGPALADKPHPWQMNFQDAATPVAESLRSLHDGLLIVITAITLFVTALLAYVMVRFRESRNPVPSKTAHNTTIEVLWTVLPVLILVGIAIPSFRLLYLQDRVENPEMTIKAIGRQWYWSYEYPDHGNFTFDAYMVKDADLKPGQMRLLETDNQVVVPVDTNVRLYTTASDVLHAWTIPAFGIKIDAITGRLNESWFRVTKPGTYYGQCSELCGVGHAFMPITVKAVSKAEFEKWIAEARGKFNKADGSPPDAIKVDKADAAVAPATQQIR
jgi:cytochrome c oxidase subunit 2